MTELATRVLRQLACWPRNPLLRSVWISILAGLAVYPLSYRSIVLSDEGLVLQQALDILHGKILYRDMDAFVSPGIWYLLAGVFALVEPSILAGRMVAWVSYVCLVLVCYRIVDRLAGPFHALAATAALVVAYVWAFPAWTFPFYSQYAVLFAMAALERVLAWCHSRKTLDLFFVGTFIGLSIAFKQNYGMGALAGVAAAILVIGVERRERGLELLKGWTAAAVWTAVGVGAVLAPIIAYFASAGALGPLYRSLVVHPFTFMGHQSISYLFPSFFFLAPGSFRGLDRFTYGAVPWIRLGGPTDWLVDLPIGLYPLERLHVLLYWFPPIAILALLWFALRRRESPQAGMAAVALVGGGTFLGVLPRADFAHLMNVYQPVLVVGVLLGGQLLRAWRGRESKRTRRARLLASALLGAYVLLALFWYNRIRVQYSEPLQLARSGVLTSLIEADLIEEQVAMLRDRTSEDEALLTVPDLTMYNFLADRPVPSRYYNLYEHHIAHDDGEQVVAGAEANRVRWVLARYNNFFSDRVGLREYAPILWQYLRHNFRIEFAVSDNSLLFLHRLERPLPSVEAQSVLTDCDVPQELGLVRQVIRNHLLFSTLYLFPDAKERVVDTRCKVRVPPSGSLEVNLGFRKPLTADPGTELIAEVWAESGGKKARLFQKPFSVIAQDGWIDDRWKPFRIDLSRYSGETIQLRLRTELRGRIEMDALDVFGFALEWNDPRLVSNGTEPAS